MNSYLKPSPSGQKLDVQVRVSFVSFWALEPGMKIQDWLQYGSCFFIGNYFFKNKHMCVDTVYIYTVYLFIYCTVQYSTVYITYCICISWLMSFTIYSFRWYFYSNCIPCSVATSTKHLFAWNSRNMRRQRSSTERTSRERTVVQHIL